MINLFDSNSAKKIETNRFSLGEFGGSSLVSKKLISIVLLNVYDIVFNQIFITVRSCH